VLSASILISNHRCAAYEHHRVAAAGRAARPAAGCVALRGGPAPALDPFPMPGRSSLFAFLQVAYHCWDSRAAVCVRRPGTPTHCDSASWASSGRCPSPTVCGFRVDCVLLLGGDWYSFISLVLGPLNSLFFFSHLGVEVTELSTNKQYHLSSNTCQLEHIRNALGTR